LPNGILNAKSQRREGKALESLRLSGFALKGKPQLMTAPSILPNGKSRTFALRHPNFLPFTYLLKKAGKRPEGLSFDHIFRGNLRDGAHHPRNIEKIPFTLKK
jgi:hypothetical protein